MTLADVHSWAPADTSAFAALFRAQPGGVAVVTADCGTGPVALTATSVSSVSIDPPMLVLSVSDASSAAASVTRAATLVIHFLDESNIALGRLAATSGIDRFADTSLWSRLPSGEPSFHGVDRRVRVRVTDRVRAGTATVLIAEALEVGPGEPRGARPLVYHDRNWHALGDDYVI